MRSWFRRLAGWLGEARLSWLGIAVVALGFYVSLSLDLSEPYIRLTGLTLQILGLLTVLYGISKTRQLFNLPTVSASVISWLKRFPPFRLKGVTGRMIGLAGEVNAAGRVKARFTVGPDSPLESRVRALESNFRILDETVDRLQQQAEERDRLGREAIQAESQARQREVKVVSEKLALAQTGGLTLSLIGLIWLIVGLAITTLSPELASWR